MVLGTDTANVPYSDGSDDYFILYESGSASPLVTGVGTIVIVAGQTTAADTLIRNEDDAADAPVPTSQ